MFIITLAFTAHCCHREQSNTQLCTALKFVTKTNLTTKTDLYELSPEDGQSESLIDLNVDVEYDSSYVYVHRSNNELVEINKDVDESEEDAGNGTNDDNGLLGYSDKHDCNQIMEYENDQWIVEHMLEGVSSSNAKLHLWEFLICINQHSFLPWSMITNSTSRGGKKAPPWQPRLLQVFKTGLMNAKDSSTRKTKYQAVITYKVYHQMATVRWLTWKLDLSVNDLRPVLSLIDTQDRKQKDGCHVSNMAPSDRFRLTHSSTYSKQQVTSKNMKMTTLPLQVSRGKNGCGKPQLFLVSGKASANNVATMTVVTAEDVKLEGTTEIVNGASIFIHSMETGPKEPRECIEDIVTQCNEPPAEPGPKSTS
jgi:hypothetical protein